MNLREYCDRQEKSLLNLCQDAMLLQAVNAAYQLDLFSFFKEETCARDVAKEKDWDEEVLELLLNLFGKAGYVKKDNGSYQATANALQSMTQDSFGRLDYLFFEETRPGQLDHKLLKALQKEKYDDFKEPDWNEEKLRVIGIFSIMQHFWEVIDNCDLSSCKRFLDVGGGHGLYSIAFSEKYPDLKATVWDLEKVLPLTKKMIARFKREEQVGVQKGNFLTEDIPAGYDVLFCSNVLHEDKRDIVLKKAYNALEKGGRIIVRNRVADGEDDLTSAMEKLEWRLMSDTKIYTIEWWKECLKKHGFSNPKVINVSGFFATIEAVKE